MIANEILPIFKLKSIILSNMETFSIKKRIYYHDTDCGGVVYYANYLRFFEEVRTEQLLTKGIDLNQLGKEEGIQFAVKDVNIVYKGPAKYGDEIIISSKIEKIKPASICFHHEVKKDEHILIECKARLVSIDMNFKPAVIPPKVSACLRGSS